MTVTLVAVLTEESTPALPAAAGAAARAGAGCVMVSDAADGPAARLPFELSDFDPGRAPRAAPAPRADFEALATETGRHGVGLAISVGDAATLTRVAALPRAALHLTAAALLDLPLVAAAAGVGTPLWLDTAMASLDEVAEAVAAAVKAGGRVTLLHGLATVPARLDEMNLRALLALRARFGLAVGFAAREPVPSLVTAAVALGATVVAVPFGPGGFDAAGFAGLAADVRLVAQALGDGDKRVQPSEWAERDRVHPSLVARVDIVRGQALTADVLDTRRPGIGLKPRAAAGIVGRRAVVDIPAGTLITLGMIE